MTPKEKAEHLIQQFCDLLQAKHRSTGAAYDCVMLLIRERVNSAGGVYAREQYLEYWHNVEKEVNIYYGEQLLNDIAP